jgi:RNA recognition motif-containing protein
MWVRNNKGNVFVGNLPPDFPDERLAETFDPFGIVLSAGVARDPNTGARLRYGFVDIATEKAAMKAIAALDGSVIDGCKLNVKPRDKAAKKPGTGGPRRPAARGPRPNGKLRDFTEMPPRRPGLQTPLAADETGARPAAPRPSQSQLAREGMPEIEPPPRRDFEIPGRAPHPAPARPVRNSPQRIQRTRRKSDLRVSVVNS